MTDQEFDKRLIRIAEIAKANRSIAYRRGEVAALELVETMALLDIERDGTTVPKCGFVPPTPGYMPCTRVKGHEGPCAHEPIGGERP